MRTISNRKRFIALLTLVCAIAILVSSVITYAWSSMNTDVNEETYGMSAKVTPNLVISTDAIAIASYKPDQDKVTEITIPSLTDTFTAATHYTKNASNTAEVLDGLHCLSSYIGVNEVSGFSEGNAELIPIPTNDGKRYYVDYTVFVASTDIAIQNTKLSISLGGTSKENSDTLSWQAGSVDFYLDSVTEENFQGTLNLAGLDAKVNDGTTEKESLEITLTDNCIPKNTEGSIKLIFRCYFDGALILIENEEPRCFVNTATVSSGEVSFDIFIEDVAIS